MNRALLVLGMLLALSGCSGGEGGAPTESASDPGWERVSPSRGVFAALTAAPPASEGDAEQPVALGAAPRTHRGQVGALGNSYYTLSTGAGAWMATLTGLQREGALFVYASPDFSRPYLCSAVSFLASSEACTVQCAPGPCSFGVRVYGFEDAGTPFLLTVE
jgi:hypothetical protein